MNTVSSMMEGKQNHGIAGRGGGAKFKDLRHNGAQARAMTDARRWLMNG
jgi:hypothetical protein